MKAQEAKWRLRIDKGDFEQSQRAPGHGMTGAARCRVMKWRWGRRIGRAKEARPAEATVAEAKAEAAAPATAAAAEVEVEARAVSTAASELSTLPYLDFALLILFYPHPQSPPLALCLPLFTPTTLWVSQELVRGS